jgi:hypothetical protein
MKHLPAPGKGQPPPSDDLKAVLDVSRAQILQEFQISERLDNKARNQVALAGTWYALAQAVAGIALRTHGGTSAWSVLIVVLAAFAGATLAITMIYSYRVWRLRPENDFTPDALRQMLSDAEENRSVIEGIVRTYANTLSTRRENNAARDAAFTTSTNWWMISVGLTLSEIFIALAAVVF